MSGHGTGPGLVLERGLVKSGTGALSKQGSEPVLVTERLADTALLKSMRSLYKEGLRLERVFVSSGFFCLNMFLSRPVFLTCRAQIVTNGFLSQKGFVSRGSVSQDGFFSRWPLPG